ncbi:hypothetical protein CBR_g30056 [Chara braunii]|uniref:Uncharacterized protein n=1 Tax=Chara braunii TaxID=69332 RepID=A0A388LBY0_CHABU|nr:hypothetical protein CBR_g30056 [Chara braunii]|eukprot:GBG79794.1 hypothetical protein CBR_g30056 [Chara braunii]
MKERLRYCHNTASTVEEIAEALPVGWRLILRKGQSLQEGDWVSKDGWTDRVGMVHLVRTGDALIEWYSVGAGGQLVGSRDPLQWVPKVTLYRIRTIGEGENRRAFMPEIPIQDLPLDPLEWIWTYEARRKTGQSGSIALADLTVRVESEERIEQFKQHIQMKLEYRWKSTKLTLDTLHSAKDIGERIGQFFKEWLGGEREGWVAELSWSGDDKGEEDKEDGRGERTVPRDYRLKFKDWLSIDCSVPLRPAEDFPDPFPPHPLSGSAPGGMTPRWRPDGGNRLEERWTVPSSAREISTLKERNESPPSTPVRGKRGSGAENRPPRAPEKKSRDDRSATMHRRTKKRISYKDDRTVKTIDIRGSDDRHSGPQVEEEEEHDHSALEKSDGAEDEEPGNEGDDNDSSRRQSQDTDEDDDSDGKSASERTGEDQSAASERGGSPFPSRTLRREGERQARNGSDTEERVGDRQIVQHVSTAEKVHASGGAVQGPKDEGAAFAKKMKGKLLRSVAKAFAFSAANEATLYPTEDAFFAAVQATAKLAGGTAEEGLRSHIAECGIRAVIGECNRMMTTIR